MPLSPSEERSCVMIASVPSARTLVSFRDLASISSEKAFRGEDGSLMSQTLSVLP